MILSMRYVFAETLLCLSCVNCRFQHSTGYGESLLTLSKVRFTLSFWALKKLPTATEMARSTSSARTYSLRCILALASAILRGSFWHHVSNGFTEQKHVTGRNRYVPYHTLQMSDCDRKAASRQAFSSQISKQPRKLFPVNILHLWFHLLACIKDIFLQ